jgi:hypothetical protein
MLAVNITFPKAVALFTASVGKARYLEGGPVRPPDGA